MLIELTGASIRRPRAHARRSWFGPVTVDTPAGAEVVDVLQATRDIGVLSSALPPAPDAMACGNVPSRRNQKRRSSSRASLTMAL